jgi:hypothetical protein
MSVQLKKEISISLNNEDLLKHLKRLMTHRLMALELNSSETFVSDKHTMASMVW